MLVTRLSVLPCALALVLMASPAMATSMEYQSPGRTTVAQIAVAGVGPDWASTTLLAGENVRWVSELPLGTGAYDPRFYDYTRDLMATSFGPRDIAARSTDLLIVSGVPDAGGASAWLFNRFGPSLRSDAYATPGEAVDPAQNAASLQIAIWESMLETANDAAASSALRFSAGSTIRTEAVEHLNSLHAGGSWLETENPQRELALPGVPEPATWVFVASGLLGLAAAARRRLRRPRAH